MLNVGERVGIVIDFHDIVLIDPVDRAVRAVSDLLAAFDRYDAVLLLHSDDLGEAGHIEDLVDFGIYIHHPKVGIILLQAQDNAQARTGYILQFRRVQNRFAVPESGQLIQDLVFGLLGIDRIDLSP